MADAEPKLTLDVATPLGLVLSTDTASVQAPSVHGQFGVLPGHLPLLAALRAGVLRWRDGLHDKVAAIGPGFVEAGPQKVLLLTESFVLGAEVDAAAARAELEAAEKKLTAFPEAYEGPDYDELQRAVDWAQARLDAAAEAGR
jgi:F-type H+-transporting ATPase subunit epsilon